MIYISSKPEVSAAFDLIRMGLSMTHNLFESSPVVLVIGIVASVIVALCGVCKQLAKHPESCAVLMKTLALFMVAVLSEEKAVRIQNLMKTYGRSGGKK